MDKSSSVASSCLTEMDTLIVTEHGLGVVKALYTST